jgi:hypothetical protein
VGAGSATITVSDSLGASTTVTVTVSTGALTVNPPSLTFTVGGAGQSFDASEADYTGLISAASSNTSRATVSPASGSGPLVHFTVAPAASSGVDTTIGVSDTHGGLTFVDITITGPLTPTPSGLTFAGTTAPQTVNVSDPNYSGTISASSTNAGVATVNSSSTGPSGSFSVTPVSMGSATINFSDVNGGATSVDVTVNAGPLDVSTNSVTIKSAGGSAPFTASENDYTGLISASSDNTSIATVSPASGSGPGPASFTITAGSTAGSTTVHVTDDHGGSTPISVLVILPPTVAPSSLSFSDIGASNAQTVTATEPGYSGAFGFAGDTCTGSGIASLSSAGSGPSSTITVTPLAGGTCSFSVQDIADNLTSNAVSVTVGPFGSIVPSPTTLTFGDITPQSFTVSESGYTGNFTIDQSGCSGANIATVNPLTGNSATTFTVTPSSSNPTGGTCNVNVTDDHGTTAGVVAVTVGPFGTVALSPTSLSLNTRADLANGTFSVSETGYSGSFTVDDSVCSAADVATVNPNSGGSSTSFKVKAAGTASNCGMAVSDDHGGIAKLFVFVTSGAITISPTTIQFASGTPASQDVTVFDPAATTYFASSNASGIASVFPASKTGGGSVVFTVSTTGATGQASITITDDAGSQGVVSVGVGMSPLFKKHKPIIRKPIPVATPTPRPHLHRPIVAPPGVTPRPHPAPAPMPSAQLTGSLTVSTTNVMLVAGSQPQQVMISETGYARRFEITTSNANVARVAGFGNGPLANIGIQPIGVGTAIIRVADDHGGVMSITVVVRPPRPPVVRPIGRQGGA